MPISTADIAVLTGTNPGANAEVSETVASGKYYELLSVSISLVQGLTQTPQPILVLKDSAGTVIYESWGSTTAQSVSTTCRYNWAPGLTLTGLIGATTNVHACAPLPLGLILGPGFTITTNTIGLGANSDYAAPTLYVARISA